MSNLVFQSTLQINLNSYKHLDQVCWRRQEHQNLTNLQTSAKKIQKLFAEDAINKNDEQLHAKLFMEGQMKRYVKQNSK
jgi:hypothetical protein